MELPILPMELPIPIKFHWKHILNITDHYSHDFLETTKEEFRSYGLKAGPAKRLSKFVEDLNEQKLRAFSSYKSIEELKKVLKLMVKKLYVSNNSTQCLILEEMALTSDTICFSLVFEEIDDNDKALKQCMKDITLRLSNLETMQSNANEVTRCVFMTSILNASLAIVRRLTNEEKIYIACFCAYHTNKKKRTADQAFRSDDYDYLYGIVSTSTEWHFIIFATDGLYCTSKNEYRINLTKEALKEDLESIRKGVKKVIGIIVGLLKDRITVSDGPESKKWCCSFEHQWTANPNNFLKTYDHPLGLELDIYYPEYGFARGDSNNFIKQQARDQLEKELYEEN
ncbi:hypothetical protein Glove_332g6 [Diversispora epigaea]|uniref:Uncharacterized protein n=1 Tax=Diversispora epigaea TaxID=1348612 RepID=A0A397HRM4_9GLOM|nr:hypothetical protein Glove_332g6 [Diversispora epigaea]